MELPHEQIGTVGDRGATPSVRIELTVRSLDGVHRCVPLHDESVGSLARVYGGQLRQGNFRLPVAVKVQRDAPLSREQSESVAAKFDTERAAYLRVHPADAPPRSDVSVVRYLDLTQGPDAAACAVIPPSVLCRHARHALHPRCPSCGWRLEADQWAPSDDDRSLACGGCGRRFSAVPERKDEIVRATARKDDGCEGCTASDDECRRSAHFLNFFPARVLVLDLLDLDLEDYLLAAQDGSLQARHPRFWERRPAISSGTGEERLAEALDLFTQLIAGVRHLHGLGIAHLDLKPRNVCLSATASRIDLRIIDLGFAADPTGLEHLRQAQGERRLDSEYAAPEVRSSASAARAAKCQPHTDSTTWLVIDPCPLGYDDPFDPLVLPGDAVEAITRGDAATAHRGVVRQVATQNDKLLLRVEWSSSGPLPNRGDVDIRVLKEVGPAADLFSLGVVLLSLLTGDTRLRPVRDALPMWLAAARGLVAASASPRQLVVLLRQRPGAGTELLRDLAGRLERFGSTRRLGEELFGIALRLVLRVPEKGVGTYLRNRNGDAATALNALERDVAVVQRGLDAVRATLAAEADRRELQAAASAVRLRVEALPPGQPAAPGTRPPPFDRERLDHILRTAREQAMPELLEAYGGNRRWLADHLNKYGRAEVGIEPEPSEAEPDHRILVEVMRLGRAIPTHPSVLRQLTVAVAGVDRLLAGKTAIPAVARAELEQWTQAAAPLAEEVEGFDTGLAAVGGLFNRINHLFTRDLERQRGREHPSPVEFRLGPGLRPRLGDDVAFQWLRRGRELVAGVRRLAKAIERRFEAAFAGWASLPNRTRSVLGPLAREAEERRAELTAALADWEEQAQNCIARLSGHYQTVSALVLAQWDRGSQASFWDRLLGRQVPARIVLGIELLDATEQADPTKVLTQFQELHLGPVVLFHANVMLDEVRVLRELYAPPQPKRPPDGVI